MSDENLNVFDQDDIEKNKTMAALAYLIFFIPLIACPESAYAKFHANQALLLLLCNIAASIVIGFLWIISWALFPLLGIAYIVFAIMWARYAYFGNAKELPIIGKFRIIK